MDVQRREKRIDPLPSCLPTSFSSHPMTRYERIIRPLNPDDPRHARMLAQRQTATLRSRYLEAITNPAHNCPDRDDYWSITKFYPPYHDLEPVKFPKAFISLDHQDIFDEGAPQRSWREGVRLSWKSRERGILHEFEELGILFLSMQMEEMPEGWDALFKQVKKAGTAKGLIPCLVREWASPPLTASQQLLLLSSSTPKRDASMPRVHASTMLMLRGRPERRPSGRAERPSPGPRQSSSRISITNFSRTTPKSPRTRRYSKRP